MGLYDGQRYYLIVSAILRGHHFLPSHCENPPLNLLADLLFECIVEEEFVPGRIYQARSAGMALASVLSIQLCLDTECQHVNQPCQRVTRTISGLQLGDLTLTLVADAIYFLAGPLTTP